MMKAMEIKEHRITSERVVSYYCITIPVEFEGQQMEFFASVTNDVLDIHTFVSYFIGKGSSTAALPAPFHEIEQLVIDKMYEIVENRKEK